MNKLTAFEATLKKTNKFEDIRPGWTIKVFQQITEGAKTRVQAFEGMVLARKHGNTPTGTITVRKVANGIGVEKIFPIYLPSIEKVDVIRKAKVRRAKLYYIKEKSSREIRKKIKQSKD